MQSTCEHNRSELIAKRDGVDYVRCLECGQIFEADDLDTVPVYEDEEESPRPPE
jgi:uncharacterized Zn finger protein